MTDQIRGTTDEILARVTAVVREEVPTANCEIQDYGHQIGCGDVDEWGNVQDVKLRRDHWNETHVREAAKALATKIRTGGSTAG